MNERKDMTNEERNKARARLYISRLIELAKTEAREVYIKTGTRCEKREYRMLRENLEDVNRYCDYQETELNNKLVTIELTARQLLILADFLKKPYRDVTKDDMKNFEKWLRQKYSEHCRNTFKQRLRPFFRWLMETENYPDSVRWMKCSYDDKRFPVVLTTKEIEEMIKACESLRDRAIVAVLAEAGCRAGELVNIRIKDLVFDSYGVSVIVNGKTRERRIRLVSSVRDISQWLNVHPKKNDPNAMFICNLAKNSCGYPMNASSLDPILQKLARKAGITKHVYAHLFRHTRATALAKHMTEAQLRVYFGWKGGSSMPSLYVHLSGADIENKVLEINGIKKEDAKEADKLSTVTCRRCSEINSVGNNYCTRCSTPLTEERLQEDDRAEEFIKKVIPSLLEEIARKYRVRDIGDIAKILREKSNKE